MTKETTGIRQIEIRHKVRASDFRQWEANRRKGRRVMCGEGKPRAVSPHWADVTCKRCLRYVPAKEIA